MSDGSPRADEAAAKTRTAIEPEGNNLEVDRLGGKVVMAVSGEPVAVNLSEVGSMQELRACVADQQKVDPVQIRLLSGSNVLKDTDDVPVATDAVVSAIIREWKATPAKQTYRDYSDRSEEKCPRCGSEERAKSEHTNFMHGFVENNQCGDCSWQWKCNVSCSD
jgi:hypothetical protein